MYIIIYKRCVGNECASEINTQWLRIHFYFGEEVNEAAQKGLFCWVLAYSQLQQSLSFVLPVFH